MISVPPIAASNPMLAMGVAQSTPLQGGQSSFQSRLLGGPSEGGASPLSLSQVGGLNNVPGLGRLDAAHEALQAGRIDDMAFQRELLAAQVEVHQHAFKVEVVSKVVEHATSGTRTIMQTQA